MFDGWAIAHQSRTCGRKIFRPYTCGGARRVRDRNVWAIAHQSRAPGRKIFRPYKCGALLNSACATIYGAAMVHGWAMAHQRRT